MKLGVWEFKNLLFILTLMIFSACLPEQQLRNTTPTINQASNNSNNEGQEELKLSQVANFLQLGTLQSTTTLSIFANYADSFLLRGNNINDFLAQNITQNQSNYCLVASFPGASGAGAKNVLILSARIRAYYNPEIKNKEYFLQMESNQEVINQGDCLTVSLVDKLQSIYNSTDFAFKLEDVCPNCNTNINSASLRLFTPTAKEEVSLSVSHLYLNIIPKIGSTTTSTPASCTTNANCTPLNFNCCLSGQCVNHGEVRSEVDQTSDRYKLVVSLLTNNPELIVNYTDIFYVCPEMVPKTVYNNPDAEIDPVQQAADLLIELEQLYNCTTPQIDEFAICTRDFTNASSLMAGGAYSFSAYTDDLTFSSFTPATGNNIVQVDFGGATYYKEKLLSTDSEISLPSSISLAASNDSLSTAQTVNAQLSLPADAVNDTFTVYYKIDGTCEKLGTSLARCKKYYKQGQSSTPARSSDHSTGSQSFVLPSYADTSFNVIVEVNGASVPPGIDTWSIVGNSIVFNGSSFPIADNQEITITYFVSSNISELTYSKELAQSRIDEHCACDPNEKACTLKPVISNINGNDVVTSYSCIYPEAETLPIPLQTTVLLSAKTVPQKFYDINGVNYDLLNGNGSNLEQEGNLFEYTDGNTLKPNNLTQHIGFNEIYGSMNIDAASPVPPKVVEVEKGKNYDIFVDQGAFSTCLNCGTDYFSSLQKVFPHNFYSKGGGYVPDFVESRRRTNMGEHKGDDTRFGRACFVPATMIPWTHVANTDVTTQRRNRLAAQHFLFANGYNRDWYGFDYAALIGSFDGIKWFAIGNQRRITAKSNKLYLAINAYFGDLTINNTYKVMINEMTSVLNSGSLITHDTENDGAECQKAHFCSKDEDCIANLGYDYTCQNVSELMTPWPLFNSNGEEVGGSANTSLLSLVGGSNGKVKRCVYRGVGAVCEQRPANTTTSSSYTMTTTPALHTCSNNSVCLPLTQSQFNTKISRFGNSPIDQNIQSFITDKTDTFGLGARILGRPYDYYGSEKPSSTVSSQLSSTNVNALCVPGKDINNAQSTQDMNYLNSSPREADIINNVGRTISSNTLQDENYLAACPATNDDGNYTHFQNLTLNDNSHARFAIRNNLSTNSLELPSLDRLNLFNDSASLITQIGYQHNTCLRAPGAKCFSDFECAPNSFISSKIKTITNFNGEISSAEEAFWEEELVCANSQPRYVANSNTHNPYYETFENHCCRETGNSFTFYSQPHENADFTLADASGNPLVPGVNMDINNPLRYSRIHTIYDKHKADSATYPLPVVASPRPATPHNVTGNNIRQYNTIHLNNERMCCTGHWVRNFAEGTNGNNGGHYFTGTSQQSIDLRIFKTLSWNPNNDPPINDFGTYDPIPFLCNNVDVDTADCEVKNIIEGSFEEAKYLDWFSKFELIGIPQVLIETNNDVEDPLTGDFGLGAIDPQQDQSSFRLPIKNTIKDVNIDGVVDAIYGGTEYYSAASYDNFEIGSGKLKKVFSENKFNCCVPTGVEVDPTQTTNNDCCSGRVGANPAGINVCCLDDFADLSAYTNRYVSSEGAFFNGAKIDDSQIDAETGYINPEIVKKMATTMCCSGRAATGFAINNYLIPGASGVTSADCKTTRRWTYDEELDKKTNGGSTWFNRGLKWNNHVYCLPKNLELNDSCNGGASGDGGAVTQ